MKLRATIFQTSHSHWNSWWICVPRCSLKKHVTVSGGATGRRMHNLYPKSEGLQKMSWPRNSTREMELMMKTHKSIPQQPWCHDFQTPCTRARPSLSNSFSWIIQIHEVDGKLQPNSYPHIESQIFTGFCFMNHCANWCTRRQLGRLWLSWLWSSAENLSRSINPSDQWHTKKSFLRKVNTNGKHSYTGFGADCTSTFPRSQPFNLSRVQVWDAADPRALHSTSHFQGDTRRFHHLHGRCQGPGTDGKPALTS